MSRPKVCFVGNCQAQAFQSLSSHLDLQVEVLLLPPIFAIGDDSRSNFNDIYRKSDFIFNQRVDGAFGVDFVRGDYVNANYTGKSLSWPNIYFDGYFPGIRYLYNDSGEKVTGPLGDYHFTEIIEGWKKRCPVDEIVEQIQDIDVCPDPNPVETSLLNLMKRESDLDCTISNYIRDNFRYSRLFYSMNHPTNPTLLEMLRRLFVAANIDFAPKNNISTYSYTLDQVILPIREYCRNKYRPTFAASSDIKSFVIGPSGERRYVTLTWREVVEGFYKTYDSISSRIP